MKVCKDCSIELTKGNRYEKYAALRCKSCVIKRATDRNKNNPEMRAKALHNWNNSEKGREAKRRYKKYDPIRNAANGKRYREKYLPHLKKAFGMSRAEYDVMLAAQNGVCGICGNTEVNKLKKCLSVDHWALHKKQVFGQTLWAN